jgi:hypothetical protein
LYPNVTLTFVRTPDITAEHHTANSLASYAPETVLVNSSTRKCGKIPCFPATFFVVLHHLQVLIFISFWQFTNEQL